eukprot:jgi/Ulvmu1/6967/UM033_0024.1
MSTTIEKSPAAPQDETAGSTHQHVQFLPLPDCDKVARHAERQEWRKPLYTIKHGQLYELPGRPHVVWTLRDYGHPCYGPRPAGAKLAREDFTFLFRAFESGQTPPHRLKKGQAHSPTIHEYLDWTVTGAASADADDVDFGGFRTILLYPRHKPEYPPHGAYERTKEPPPEDLGGSRPPLPDLMTKGTKPVAAATIRVGQGYLEIPFFATSDGHRGKGYGRCLLEAIEQIARRLKIPRMMLCSTDDDKVRAVWERCGFEYTMSEHIAAWDVKHGDQIFMTNTVQMHKLLTPPPRMRPFVIEHGAFRTRVYVPLDTPSHEGLALLHEAEVNSRKRMAPSKGPPKKVAKAAKTGHA